MPGSFLAGKPRPVGGELPVVLPYPVDADRAEVRKENGLISIILKKD
jgi:HSP20 family molecular chaperone IbpA